MEGTVTSPSDRDDKGYYRSMTTDKALYEAMKSKYDKYISVEYLKMCCHLYDTQLNEGMNRSVCKYVPKGTNFCRTNSLVTRVYIAAGIQLVGNHFLWVQVMSSLGLCVPVQTELYLLDLDKRKMKNYCRVHDFANMAKRKQSEHDKIRKHLLQVKNDQKRNATYSSMTGCEGGKDIDGASKRRKTNKSGGAGANLCKYAIYGCGGMKSHKTNVSRHCKFHGISHKIIGTYELEQY